MVLAWVVGGPVLPINLAHPTVASQVKTGTIHDYFEVYGANLDAFTTTFEVASDERSPALIAEADVTVLPAGDD